MSQTLSLQRSREELKRQGYATWIVEKPYNPYTKRREDLFNFADLVGIREDISGVTAIQATGEDCSGHIRKLLEGFSEIPPNPYLKTWLQAGNRFFIWSWRMRGKQGKRKLWKLREIEFLLDAGQVIHREIPHETV